MPWLSVTFLGGFRARLGSGRPVVIPTKKGQALLAYLGLRPGEPESREKVATLLWGDADDRQARHNLRQTVFALRGSLPRTRPAALMVSGETLALNAAAVEVDVASFERLVAEGTPAALASAIALYQGEFLEGSGVTEAPFEEWLSGERERLRAMALSALNRLLNYQSQQRDLEAAVRTALRLLALDPLQETVHRTLMQLHARQGRYGLALRQYQVCVELLQRELGVEPDAETKEAYRALLPGVLHAPAAPRTRTASLRPAERRRHARAELPSVEGALIGREPELRRLQRLLADAWRGRGGMGLIVGDAGIGKTRLVRELAATALKRRGRVLVARCYESEQVLAFGPWVEALRGWLAARPRALTGLAGVWRAELVRLLPELAEPGYSPLATPDDHLRLFETIARVVEHLLARRPRLIVLEDVHWADEMSVRLLPFLSRHLQGSPALLVATARSDEVPGAAALARALGELRQDDRLVTLSLSPLSREESGRLVRDRAGPKARGVTLARLEEQVWTLSAGNPFMIVEAMRAVGECPTFDTTEGLRLPDRIREMITGRLERLSDLGQNLAGIAALIGREFGFSVVQRAAGLSPHMAAEGMEELVRRRILQGVGKGFDFSHERIREVAGDRLRGPRRKLLHARIAQAIEEVYAPNLAPHYAALGWHYRQGEAWENAVAYLRQAAVQAMERSAYREAAELFKQTLIALDSLPRSRQTLELAIDLRLDLRRCLNPLGDNPEILDHLREAERHAEDLGDDTRVARVLSYLMHELTLRGQREETVRCGERALGIAERLGDASLLAAVSYFIGEMYQIAGDYRQGAEFFRRSVEATREDPFPRRFDMSGIPSVVSRAYLTLCLIYLGELETARSWAEEAIQMAKMVAHPYSLAFAHWALGLVLTAKGELDEAIAVLERGHELCRTRELEQPYGLAPALGFALALKGRREDGLRLVEAGVQRATASSVRKASAAGYTARLADAYVLCGRAADGRRLAQDALDLARTYGEKGIEAYSLLILAKAAALDASEMPRSEALHREATTRYTALGMRTGLASCHLSLGRLYARWGRRDEARAELVVASTMYRSMGANAPAVSAEQALAAIERE